MISGGCASGGSVGPVGFRAGPTVQRAPWGTIRPMAEIDAAIPKWPIRGERTADKSYEHHAH